MTLALAWRRQLSHHEARYARAAREAALADPDLPGGRREGYGEFGGDELRVALVESRTRVSKLLGQAQTAIEAIPELWAAWDAGLIDTDRVRLCVTWTSSLSAEHAASVVRRVLPEAPALTLAGLIERLQQLATALDPLWAERLYENSRRQRRVRARRTESGTVNLSGLDLPLDAGALSTAHVEALALRAKALGHPGLIDTIRADIYLALLGPRPEGWDDDALVAHIAANACPTDPRGRRAPVHVGGSPPAGEPADDHAEAEPGDAEPGHAEPGHAEPDDAAPGHAKPDGADDEREAPSRLRGGGTRRSRIELRVGLLTLLGADEKPGFLPGYGVVHAPFARNFARQLCAAEWRVAVTDEEGRLIAALLTRRRPPGYATTPTDVPPIVPRPVVELHVRESELATLRLRDHPAWVPMLTRSPGATPGVAATRTPHARRRTTTRPSHRTGPVDPDAGPHVRVPALPGVGAHLGHRPHGRRRPRRADGGREPRPGVPARPPRQARGRLAPRPARGGHVRLDQPHRPLLRASAPPRHPRRPRPRAGPVPLEHRPRGAGVGRADLDRRPLPGRRPRRPTTARRSTARAPAAPQRRLPDDPPF